MKVIITEQQHDKFKKTILDFFEENLTPYEGWMSTENYKRELEIDGELFLFLVDSLGSGEDDHMWYSSCDNPNLKESLPEGHCPLLELPMSIYGRLDGYFGDIWKSLLKKWFEDKTGLPVIRIDTIY